tara:strand:- start:232 stop:648 length:417 start_codon:yes stop_codon:yes gene_type:complete
MEQFNYITSSYDETIKIGEEISKKLKPNVIIGLIGNLAAGKTTFVKGFLKGLGYKYTVSSPTFTLINNYDAKYNVMHVDFYREANMERWREIGFKDLLINSQIVLVEWADLLPDLLPEETLYIKFEHGDNNTRKIYSL